MSEVMIFSVKAQVYILDQDLQTWSPHTFSVVPVSYYSDPSTGRTRIIAMENSEPKVNSLLLPEMVFHRPSDTFGQWLDPTAGDLYGLNFTSKADAESFEKTFSDNVAKAANIGQSTTTPVSPANFSRVSTSTDESEKLRKELAELRRQLAEKDNELQRKVNEASAKNPSQATLNSKIDSLSAQLNVLTRENEGYKSQISSLKSSSQTNEEAKLRAALTDLEKLKQALRQSSANADAWQRQLAAYQKENQELKAKIQKMIELQKGFASVLS